MKRNHAGREKPTSLMRRPFIRGFDYESLAPEARARVEASAAKIKELNRSMGSAAVAMGVELIAVRQELGKRLFSVFIVAELNFSQATCSNLMSIGRRFADLDCLEQFDHSALYEIARPRVPPAAVEETIQLARAGERVSKAKALTVIEKHEMAAETDPAPKPRRDEVGRLKSMVRVAIGRWPASEREILARQLLQIVGEVMAEFGIEPQAAAPPRLATPSLAGSPRSKPVRGDVRSRAAAMGIAVG